MFRRFGNGIDAPLKAKANLIRLDTEGTNRLKTTQSDSESDSRLKCFETYYAFKSGLSHWQNTMIGGRS